MKLAQLKKRRERGATIVEAAIVFPLLFLVIFAVVEFGLAFKDWLTVSHAAREGARAGATYGDDIAADYLILQDIGRHLGPASIVVQDVKIYNAENGTGQEYDFTPGANCAGSDCCDWTPCPNPDLPSPPYATPIGFPPTSRDVAIPGTSFLGVEVTYDHQWITGLFGGTTTFTSTVEYHLEPQVFDTDG
jgi:hypothetical protein